MGTGMQGRYMAQKAERHLREYVKAESQSMNKESAGWRKTCQVLAKVWS